MLQKKDRYYFSITLKHKAKPVRMMHEDIGELKYAEEKLKNSDFQYLGQVKNHIWIDHPRKDKQTP
ncbi:hypothetical protein OAJ65_03700 [Flavobacteriales bacterium]|nr:hypothetical protein [Flavobacteriales bacterium]